MHVGEVPIDDALVSGLLAQCPALRGPLRAVRSTGTVNAIYRLGDEHYVRLPRLEQYAGDLRKECEWLPRLNVSMPIPVPVFAGEPTDDYPFPWAVFRWIEGEPYDRVTDERVAAEALARFVHELRAIDVTGAPRAGRAPLAALDEVTRPLLSGDALSAWERALEAPVWDGARTWIHGDLLRPNLLTRDGALRAVIDFIALHQAAMIIPYYRESNPAFTVLAERTVAQLTRA